MSVIVKQRVAVIVRVSVIVKQRVAVIVKQRVAVVVKQRVAVIVRVTVIVKQRVAVIVNQSGCYCQMMSAVIVKRNLEWDAACSVLPCDCSFLGAGVNVSNFRSIKKR